MDKQHLLDSKQVAAFAADGMLRFDALVPEQINQEAMREIDQESVPRHYERQGQPLAQLWPESKGFGAMIRLPQVQGIIRSLVGPDPLYDHHAFHKVGPHHIEGQTWHADAIIDTRLHFDIQLFYYPHDTPRQMGGTMFLPGSHLRRIHETFIGRYQNFVNQDSHRLHGRHPGCGPSWYLALRQPNHTDQMRYMFKLRLNPTVRQTRLWNTDDIEDPEIARILFRDHRWYGSENRIEYAQRIKFWRFLSGNERFDANYWLTRIENTPERVAA
jgi:hypothetical protein